MTAIETAATDELVARNISDKTGADQHVTDQHVTDQHVTDQQRAIANQLTVSGAIPVMAERIAQKVANTPNTTSDLGWRATASCCDTDPDLFFPVGTTGIALEQIDEAKTVCNSCPAQLACLEFALRTNQDTGIWGGTSEEERRQLRRTYLGRRRRTAV